MISASDDKTVRVWNAADGKEVKTIPAHAGPIVGLGVSADGTRLATAGADKSVKVWNLTPLKPGAKGEAKPIASFPLAAPAQRLALSPNGLRVAVAVSEAKSNPIHVFDVASGQELLVLPEHTGAVHTLSFQADNRTLLSASADRTARMSDVGVLMAMQAHAGGVAAVQFHGNGTQALSGGADKTVKLWDLAKGTVLRTFGPLPDAVSAIAFSRDFTQAAASAGKTVKVWNVADGKELATLSHPADVCTRCRSATDKVRIATGAADKLTRVWDVATGKELQFFPQGDVVHSVVFHNNNTAIVSGAGKTVTVDSLALTRMIPVSAGPIHALAVAPNGTHVLTAGADKVVGLWNLGSGVKERTFEGASDVLHAVAVSKNNVLVAAGGADRTVRIYNFADGKELKAVQAPGAVRGLAFSPNNLVLAASCADRSVQAWSAVFNQGQPLPPDFLKPLQSFAHTGPATDLAFIAPDNVTVYTRRPRQDGIRAWKFAAGSPDEEPSGIPNLVDAVASTRTGTRLATGGHDGIVRILRPRQRGRCSNRRRRLRSRRRRGNSRCPAMIYAVAWSARTASRSSAAALTAEPGSCGTRRPAGTLVREFKAYKMKDFEKGHRDSVFSVAISPDGKYLASGSGGLERVIKIWKVADGTVVRDLDNPKVKHTQSAPQSHPGWVYGLRFTRDGKRLVSAGDAPLNHGYLAVWDVDSGKLLSGEEPPLGTFYAVALSPDENLLAVAAGPRGDRRPDLNCAYLLRMPGLAK